MKLTAFDVAPPGFVTVRLKLPAVAIAEAGIAAASCVALKKVVVRTFPLKLTLDAPTKFVPFTVSAKAVPPAVALAGDTLVIVGGNARPAVVITETGADPAAKGEPTTGVSAPVVLSIVYADTVPGPAPQAKAPQFAT
jgi:hypothetical protein